ncbi:hypothetical protein BDZ97DRAFT_1654336 [Flammula alnicola]|nr:hypothetical protein BDZ97DRAFT_1654336 [Flammula alnicola]
MHSHGPMFIGFTLNAFLYGIMITQVYLYFTKYRQDKNWMKIFVILLLVADTANTIFDFIYLYHSLILHFVLHCLFESNVNHEHYSPDPAITGIIASLVQFFFAWRVKVLTRNWPLAAIVFLGSLSGAAGAIATSFEVGRIPQFTDFRKFQGVVIMWLASESITDIIITTILVWFLKRHKTGFQQSDYIVDRIIRITVQTGLVTSLVATLDLIFFLTDPTGTHLIFNFPLCKLYTNSLMSSLNSRRGWRYGSTKEDTAVVQLGGTLNMRTLSTANFAHSLPLASSSPPSSSRAFRHHRAFSDNISGQNEVRHSPSRSLSARLMSSLSRPVYPLMIIFLTPLVNYYCSI